MRQVILILVSWCSSLGLLAQTEFVDHSEITVETIQPVSQDHTALLTVIVTGLVTVFVNVAYKVIDAWLQVQRMKMNK